MPHLASRLAIAMLGCTAFLTSSISVRLRVLQELLRRLMIELVLATDMKQHFAIHGLFQAKLHIKAAISSQRSSGGVCTTSNSGLLPQLNTVSSVPLRDTKEDTLAAAAATRGSSSSQQQQQQQTPPPVSSRARQHYL